MPDKPKTKKAVVKNDVKPTTKQSRDKMSVYTLDSMRNNGGYTTMNRKTKKFQKVSKQFTT